MQPITVAELEQHLRLEHLRDGSIFGALSPRGVEFLVSEGNLYSVVEGERIYDFGDQGSSFFIVCQGSLSFLTQYENECYHTRNVTFGEETGYVSMIALQSRSGYAVAREDSIILEITTDLYSRLHEEIPFDFGIITLNLGRDMARTIIKLRQTLVKNSIRYW